MSLIELKHSADDTCANGSQQKLCTQAAMKDGRRYKPEDPPSAFPHPQDMQLS